MKKPTKQAPDAESISWASLARDLGIERNTLAAWRKLPGSPADIDLQAWEKFRKESGVRLMAAKDLRDEKVRGEIELLKAKVDREHRKVIDRSEVNQFHVFFGSRIKSLLYQFAESEAPPKLDGMSAVQMRPILREFADKLCGDFANLVSDFNNR